MPIQFDSERLQSGTQRVSLPRNRSIPISPTAMHRFGIEGSPQWDALVPPNLPRRGKGASPSWENTAQDVRRPNPRGADTCCINVGQDNALHPGLKCACHCGLSVLCKGDCICMTMGVYPIELGATPCCKITPRVSRGPRTAGFLVPFDGQGEQSRPGPECPPRPIPSPRHRARTIRKTTAIKITVGTSLRKRKPHGTRLWRSLLALGAARALRGPCRPTRAPQNRA